MRLSLHHFRRAGLGVFAALVVLPAALAAQFGIAIRGSTLGIGLEASYRVNRLLGIRAGGNYFEFSRNATIEEIDYTARPHFENGTVMLDLFPLGGAFHVSGGLVLNRNEGVLDARLNQSIEIGGQTYTPDQIGSLTATVGFKKTAPYLGIGFAGQGRVAFLFDLGVGFTGTPRINLAGTTPLTGPEKAEFDAQVAQEEQELRDDIEDKSYLKYHPVVAFGVKIRF